MDPMWQGTHRQWRMTWRVRGKILRLSKISIASTISRWRPTASMRAYLLVGLSAANRAHRPFRRRAIPQLRNRKKWSRKRHKENRWIKTYLIMKWLVVGILKEGSSRCPKNLRYQMRRAFCKISSPSPSPTAKSSTILTWSTWRRSIKIQKEKIQLLTRYWMGTSHSWTFRDQIKQIWNHQPISHLKKNWCKRRFVKAPRVHGSSKSSSMASRISLILHNRASGLPLWSRRCLGMLGSTRNFSPWKFHT